VRRYCLPCSARTGRLVDRVALAIERARAERRAAAKERRKDAAARGRAKEAAYFAVAGVNLHAEMMVLVRLRAFGGASGPLARRLPTLTVQRRTSRPTSRYGCAEYGARRIIIAAWAGFDAADVRETLLHELVHLFVGPRRPHRPHGTRFRSVFRIAMEEAYGVRARLETRYHGEMARLLRERARAAPEADDAPGAADAERGSRRRAAR